MKMCTYLGLSPPACDTCCTHTPSLACGRSLLVFLARLGLDRLGGRVCGADDVLVIAIIIEGWTVARRRFWICEWWLVLGHGSDGEMASAAWRSSSEKL